MESRATARYVRVTARKVNQVLELVRGRDVEDALTTLGFSKKHVAKTIEKTMRSAVANAIQADSKIDVEVLYVKEAQVGPGPIMKRWLPRAQGRATPILKRMSHITIILADKSARKGKKRPVKARTATATATASKGASKSATASKGGRAKRPAPARGRTVRAKRA